MKVTNSKVTDNKITYEDDYEGFKSWPNGSGLIGSGTTNSEILGF